MNRKSLSLIAAIGLTLGSASQVIAAGYSSIIEGIYKQNEKLLAQTITIDNVDYHTKQHPDHTFANTYEALEYFHSKVPMKITITPANHPASGITSTIECPPALHGAPRATPLTNGLIAWSYNPTENYEEKIHALLTIAVQQALKRVNQQVLEREKSGDTGMSFWIK